MLLPTYLWVGFLLRASIWVVNWHSGGVLQLQSVTIPFCSTLTSSVAHGWMVSSFTSIWLGNLPHDPEKLIQAEKDLATVLAKACADLGEPVDAKDLSFRFHTKLVRIDSCAAHCIPCFLYIFDLITTLKSRYLGPISIVFGSVISHWTAPLPTRAYESHSCCCFISYWHLRSCQRG